MDGENVTRTEYCHGQERIHNRIDEISKQTYEMCVYAKMIKESVDRMHETMYGNGKDGLMQKFTSIFERVSLHTKLVIAIILSLVAVAIKSLWG